MAQKAFFHAGSGLLKDLNLFLTWVIYAFILTKTGLIKWFIKEALSTHADGTRDAKMGQ